MATLMGRIMDFLGIDEEQEETQDKKNLHQSDEKRMRSNNVVAFQSQKNVQKTVRVVLVEPRGYDDAQEMSDNLKNHRAVVINLQAVQPDIGLRILDFLSGTVYALGGHIQKLGPGIFLCTPINVDVQGTIQEIFSEN